MKRRTLVLTIIAGLVVFLGVLVLYLPASWFASALPAQLKCAELGGSIWRGECIGLVFQGNKLGDATWNFAPGKAFTRRLDGLPIRYLREERHRAGVDAGYAIDVD